jgi:hypothetical protein
MSIRLETALHWVGVKDSVARETFVAVFNIGFTLIAGTIAVRAAYTEPSREFEARDVRVSPTTFPSLPNRPKLVSMPSIRLIGGAP